MIVEKILTDLPPWVVYEGINFELRLISNGTDEMKLVYGISYVDDDSKHKLDIEVHGCWENPLYVEGGSSTGFLYLVEGIENDNDLLAVITETRDFLIDHGFITNT